MLIVTMREEGYTTSVVGYIPELILYLNRPCAICTSSRPSIIYRAAPSEVSPFAARLVCPKRIFIANLAVASAACHVEVRLFIANGLARQFFAI